MSLEVKIKIRSTVKKQLNLPDGKTHSFIVCVQGMNGNHIEHFIKEVVFYMPANYSKPQETKKVPPYIISGSTDVSFRLLIDLFLHASKNFKKLQYSYYINIPDKPVENSLCVKTLTFLNCPQDFKERLLLGGAEVVNHEKRSKANVPQVTCKKEPDETVQNQEAFNSQNTTKQNGPHFISKSEPTEDVNIQGELSDQLPDSNVHITDVSEQNDSLVIQSVCCFDELLKENGTLKEENKTLMKKFNDQESAIAKCVEKLPALENNSLAASKELNELKEKAEANEVEIEKLKSTVQIIMSEVTQYSNRKKGNGIRKSPELSAILPPLDSEKLHCTTSLSLEDKQNGNISHNILQNEREKIVTDNCIISQSNLESLALNADSSLTHDINKNQIKSCNTSDNEVSSTSGHFSDLNDRGNSNDTFQTVLNSCHNDQDSFLKQACDNMPEEEVNQKSISHEKDKECTNSNHKEKISKQNLLRKVLSKRTIKEAINNCKEEEIPIFSSNQEGSEILKKRKITKKHSLENYPSENGFEKSAKKKSADLSYQEAQLLSTISNSVHSKNTSINRKRTILLPIPVDIKKPRRTKESLLNGEQNVLCSTPSCTSSYIPNSVKQSTIDEQILPPTEYSSNAIAAENKNPSANLVDPKTITPKSDSVSINVFKNSQIEAKGNSTQSDSTCIITDSQLKKFTEKDAENKQCKTIIPSLTAIGSILKDIDNRKISQSKFKYYVHALTEFLVNPTTSPNISSLIFLILDHSKFSKNFLPAFRNDPANCKFFPLSENCIVSSLFDIEEKYPAYSQRLIKNILNTIYYLLLSKKKLGMFVLASLCRIFTEICRRKGDLMKPLRLCANMLKVKHKFASYLIVSVVSIWKEPFSAINNQSDETMILIGSIAFGVETNIPKSMSNNNRLCIAKIISEHLGYPGLPDENTALNFLKDKIVLNCTQNSYEKSWMLTSSVIIIAAHQSYEWIQTHLLKEFIMPNLYRFSTEERNEHAFALFCDLFAHACSLHGSMSAKVYLKQLKSSYNGILSKGCTFIHRWVNIALVKFKILTIKQIKRNESVWYEHICDRLKPNIDEFKEFYLRRHMHYSKKDFTIKDIVIT